jgi:hypothetical protein
VEKNDFKLLEEKIKHFFLPLQIELALQIVFFHWSKHNKKNHIYIIQNAILTFWHFKKASCLGHALTCP